MAILERSLEAGQYLRVVRFNFIVVYDHTYVVPNLD